MTKTLGIVLIVIVAIAIGAYFFPSVTERVETIREIQVGSVAGPNISSPFLAVDNVYSWYGQTPLTQASTTLCAIKSPSATSTLVAGTFTMNSTTTASVVDIARASTAFATTTLLSASQNFAANTTINVVASTTGIWGPNQWLVVKGYNTSFPLATFSRPGGCTAEWRAFLEN